MARGLYKGEADQFTPLPQDLYHATVAADKVDAEGLKTRAEQNVDEGAGLGGGEGNTISFTTDQKIADAIATGIREGRAAAEGGTYSARNDETGRKRSEAQRGLGPQN